ncbi:UDP-3-O-acyl-N-acetylglucosamine deacetylase [Lentisphaera profundi]|uniref:UDP-3-O-acyl-N-acetylglucosamine deacetylase n=1 Tax=Lentisphaera profundi TaxID=1658616 RepID=A0ABY7VYP6_9BACT|nr:UDP-3-O-acyl-N-acetylglucosamine deacetylase [Lentisphaera profundi]WDE98393.1 UDP-3-O-acyl-N-acetylglucosamine deacetylase [Lentisphaera profundi]
MNPDKQHTIEKSASLTGIALHTGHRARLTFQPAPINTGVIFRRMDLPGKPEVHAIGTNVTEVMRGTTIEDGPAVIHTVEHVLAALMSRGIDNIYVEMDRPEPPIADGSSMPFLNILKEAGRIEQDAVREYFTIDEVQTIEMEHALITVVPDDKFRISCTVKYDQSILDTQYLSMTVTEKSFETDLSEARTFCSYFELEHLMKAGLIRGGSLDNATVIHGGTIYSKDGLRFDDEFVRHKMLDIVGDFSLLGKPLKAHIIAAKPGHPSNVTMVQKMLKLTSGTK